MKCLTLKLLKSQITFLLTYIFLILMLNSCVESNYTVKSELSQSNNVIKEGNWLGKLIIDSNTMIPFNFSILKEKVVFSNDKELINTSYQQIETNSYQIKMPVFNTTFEFSLTKDSMFGYWINQNKGDNYKILFCATYQQNKTNRFKVGESVTCDISGKWEVTFASNSDSNEFQAIGLFHQTESALSGTFITETGDYRFLQGNVINDSIFLSCFDGSHAFLFKGANDNNKIKGMFYSGIHYKESWEAIRNENFTLQNPDSISSIISNKKIAFEFPNLDSVLITYPSEKFNNKVVILQIIGSWCPNCMDETAFLSELYDQYHDLGLEIICLTFEHPDSFKDKCKNVKRLKDHFDAKYNFLIAGGSSKKEVERTLPFISNVTSFPTTIYIDKNGSVEKIHSGFYGPGTGEYYQIYIEEIKGLIENLLNE